MAELRATCPAAIVASGMIAVSRYADVRSALNDPAMRNRHAARSPGIEVPPEDRFFFFEYDPPEHTILRRLLVDLFSRHRAARLAPAVRESTKAILTPLVERGGADLVGEFGVPLAGRTMMRVAGFPEDDAPQWREWIKEMVLTGFSFTNSNDRGTGMRQCYPDVLDYLDARLAERSECVEKPDDVLTRVLEPDFAASCVAPAHQRMVLFSVVAAGTNTLVNFVGNTLHTLVREPDLLEALRADRRLVAVAVEESLRRDSPSMYITRLCAETTAVAGRAIEPGEKVLLSLASANRDGDVFESPEEFRLDREDQPPHLAFGWGSHLCLGAWVARQVGVTMLDTFLDLVGRVRLDAGSTPAPYLSPQGYGLDELRVRLVGRGT
jgi:cytochrome P450